MHAAFLDFTAFMARQVLLNNPIFRASYDMDIALYKIFNMRSRKTLLFVVVALATCFNAKAQDLHNTLFYMNPLHINPAFAGSFEGTFRIGGLYRDQARTVVTNAYSTPTFYGDAPVVMIGKRHWIGVGLLAFRDQVGDGKLRTTTGQLTGTFHYAMDKKSNNVLSLGVQFGRVSRSIEDIAGLLPGTILEEQLGIVMAATPDDVLGGGGTGPGMDGPNTDYSDWSVGLLLKSKVNKKTDYNLGFSLGHLLRPRLDYNFGSSTVRLPMRLTVHGQLNTDLNKKWTFNPEFYYSRINPSSQAQVHAWAGYKLDPKEGKDIKLNVGLGYRVSDSAQALVGVDYGDIKAQIGYDITMSSLRRANDRAGGFEIAVSYIGKVYKKPVVKPAILCPRL